MGCIVHIAKFNMVGIAILPMPAQLGAGALVRGTGSIVGIYLRCPGPGDPESSRNMTSTFLFSSSYHFVSSSDLLRRITTNVLFNRKPYNTPGGIERQHIVMVCVSHKTGEPSSQ